MISDNATFNAVWSNFGSSAEAARKPNNSILLERFSSLRLPIQHQQQYQQQQPQQQQQQQQHNVPMQIDDAPSYCQLFTPPIRRSTLKKHSRRTLPGNVPRKVIFSKTVDVRVSLSPPHTKENVWYTADEIKAMRLMAMERNSPLRHSHQIDMDPNLLQQQLMSTPPPTEDVAMNMNFQAQPTSSAASSLMMPRVHSASAELRCMPSSNHGRPQDIRYQNQLSQLDREVYITNSQRRNSTRRRLHHYCKVLDELDRQCDVGYMRINVVEMAQVSKAASGSSTVQALERARREATMAKAILMEGGRRL